jgi:serine protease Do
MAKAISLQLVRAGRVLRAHLGVRVQPLTPGLTAAFGVGQRRGLLVADVSADGTGPDTQLRLGDVLLGFNGQELDTPYDLSGPFEALSQDKWRRSPSGVTDASGRSA